MRILPLAAAFGLVLCGFSAPSFADGVMVHPQCSYYNGSRYRGEERLSFDQATACEQAMNDHERAAALQQTLTTMSDACKAGNDHACSVVAQVLIGTSGKSK